MKLTLTSQQQKDRAIEYLKALDISKPMLLVVTEAKKNRSAAQNALLWKYYTQLAAEGGYTKEEVHHDAKKRFLSKIYERDLPEYAEMVGTVRKMYSAGFKDDSTQLHDSIVKLTSTTTATVKQFSEYLDDIDKDAMQRGIFLERPEDMYREAMNQ